MSDTRHESAVDLGVALTSRENWQGRDDAVQPVAGFVRARLIPSLAKRFEVVRELPAGGEADVMVVRDGAGQLLVVKQYRRPEWSPAPEVLDILTDLRADHDADSWARDQHTKHLVWLEDYAADPATGLFWELQEYLSGGALAGVSDGTDGRIRGAWSRLGEWPILTLVAGLTEAVASFHRLIGAHRDLKPGNVLVRSRDPLVLVLADVGLARQVGDQSARISRRDGSPAYQAPEAAQGTVSRAGDWWAVGMMVAQAALGRHPLALPDGSLPDDRAIASQLAQRDVPLDGISDQRLRNLCRGLLTRDSQQRWRHAQVRAWLAGENPQVYVVDPVREHDGTSSGRVRSVRFARRDYDTPQALAAAFAAQPELAAEALFTNKDAVLLEDLRLMLTAHRLHEAQAALDRYRSGAWQPTLLRLVMEMDPQLEPTLAGLSMTPVGIAKLATEVIETGQADAAQLQAMSWVRDHDLWRIWRNQPGMSGAAEAAERLAGIRLSNLTENVEMVLTDAGVQWCDRRATVGEVLVDSAAVDRLRAGYFGLARAWALYLAAEPASAASALGSVLAANRSRYVDIDWWTEFADGSSVGERIMAASLLALAQASANELPAGRARLAAAHKESRRSELQAEQRRRVDQETSSQRQPHIDEVRRLSRAWWTRAPRGFGWWLFAVWLSANLAAAVAYGVVWALRLPWETWGSEILSVVWVAGWALWFWRWSGASIRRRQLEALLAEPPRYDSPLYHWSDAKQDWVRR